MSKQIKKTKRYAYFLFNSVAFALVGYLSVIAPSFFSAGYSSDVPSLNSVAHADTSPSSDSGTGTNDPDGSCDGVDSSVDGSCGPSPGD